jgi:dipeptidyl aminopeptidase/acylaminoacyl peptidase
MIGNHPQVDQSKLVFERFLYEAPALAANGRISPVWLDDGSRFEFSMHSGGQVVHYHVDPAQKSITEIPHLIEPEPAPVADGNGKAAPGTFTWVMGNLVPELPSPDGLWFLGVEDFNLYLRSAHDGSKHVLTRPGSPEAGRADCSWDALGASWSMDGKYLAARKVHIGEMGCLPIVHWLDKPESVEHFRFARAGEPAWTNELHIIETGSGTCVPIDLAGAPADYINIVGWLPGEILFATSDRLCKQLHLMAADLQTGKSRTLIIETQATFHNYQFFEPLPITPLADGQRFLWLSERDGWNHLYLYDLQGSLIKQLTHGSMHVYKVMEIDEENDWVYFAGLTEKRLYDLHLYRAHLDGSALTRLTTVAGTHEIIFSPSKQYFLDTHSSVERPYQTALYTASGEHVLDLARMDISLLLQAGWQAPEEFWVKAADGVTDLRGVLYKPGNFDPGKKYPVLEYIYGGPHTLDAPNSFYGISFLEAFAQIGYVCFVVDGRGTIGRGKAFQDVCYGQVGQHEIPEHIHVLHQLTARHAYMDAERVGIFGLSMGGYNTLRAMLTAPEVYKVGVATCAPPSLDKMAWAYIERFMGCLPQDQPETYQKASCLDIVDNLQGRLMLIHGTIDSNAPIAHTFQLMEAFIQAGKTVDMLVVPEQPHIFEGASSKYWFETMRRYFNDHLLDPTQ